MFFRHVLSWQPILPVFFLLAWFGTQQASAHTVFKKQLQKQYPSLVIKCELCHVKGKKKTETNDFGKLFKDEMDSANLTSQWESLKGDDKKKYEQETMAPAFDHAFETIKVLKKGEEEDAQTWHELLDSAALENIKLKKGATKGTDVQENENGDDDQDDDSGDEADEKQGDEEGGKDSKKKDDSDKDKDGGKQDGGKKDGGKKDEGKQNDGNQSR